MDDAMVNFLRDFKHGRRGKTKGTQNANKRDTMPVLLPRTRPRYGHPKGAGYPQVEVSQRLFCTVTPPPSLQSLPRIRLHGNAAQQQQCRSDSFVSHRRTGDNLDSAIPSMKYGTTQSLPSLPHYDNASKRNSEPRKKPNAQRSSTFDLFKTSRHGRRMATNNQNFAWDFSRRADKVSQSCGNTKESGLPKTTDGNVLKQKPVHLYMSVEMMDKLLEKRKGLRSDETLNELIGMPPPEKRVSKRKDKIHVAAKEDKSATKLTNNEDKERQEIQKGRQNAGPEEAASREVKKCGNPQENKEEEQIVLGQATDEEHQDRNMETEFIDNDEEELGGLVDDGDSDVFDACEDDEEEDKEDDEKEREGESEGSMADEGDDDDDDDVEGDNDDEDADDVEGDSDDEDADDVEGDNDDEDADDVEGDNDDEDADDVEGDNDDEDADDVEGDNEDDDADDEEKEEGSSEGEVENEEVGEVEDEEMQGDDGEDEDDGDGEGKDENDAGGEEGEGGENEGDGDEDEESETDVGELDEKEDNTDNDAEDVSTEDEDNTSDEEPG